MAAAEPHSHNKTAEEEMQPRRSQKDSNKELKDELHPPRKAWLISKQNKKPITVWKLRWSCGVACRYATPVKDNASALQVTCLRCSKVRLLFTSNALLRVDTFGNTLYFIIFWHFTLNTESVKEQPKVLQSGFNKMILPVVTR